MTFGRSRRRLRANVCTHLGARSARSPSERISSRWNRSVALFDDRATPRVVRYE